MSPVVDRSVTMTWCFDDEMTTATDVLLDRLRSVGALVPVIRPLDVANVLLTAERRQRITAQEAGRLARILQSVPIIVDAGKATNAFGDVFTLAREHRLSMYDASYLELAMRQGVPRATRDAHARRCGTRTRATSVMWP